MTRLVLLFSRQQLTKRTSAAFLPLLFLAVLYDSQTTVADAAITFAGSSRPASELAPRSLPREWTVNDVHDVVSRTNMYRKRYNASVITPEEEQQGNDYPTTETKPAVYMVTGSPVATDGTTKGSPMGFIGTAITAYGYHSDLVIRPDDIWITILSQFSFYVNARSEQLRDMFVSHEGQKKLEVTVEGKLETVPYDEIAVKFLDLISANLNDDVGVGKSWFLPGFTTTTKTDEVVAAAVSYLYRLDIPDEIASSPFSLIVSLFFSLVGHVHVSRLLHLPN